jgi:hypothetical protein
MQNRRGFLKLLGFAPVAVPAVVAAEMSKPEPKQTLDLQYDPETGYLLMPDGKPVQHLELPSDYNDGDVYPAIEGVRGRIRLDSRSDAEISIRSSLSTHYYR